MGGSALFRLELDERPGKENIKLSFAIFFALFSIFPGKRGSKCS